MLFNKYRQTSNISNTLVGYKIVDHSDVVGASPVRAAPTISSFSTEHLASRDWAKTTARRDERHWVWGFGAAYILGLAVGVLVPIVRCCWHLRFGLWPIKTDLCYIVIRDTEDNPQRSQSVRNVFSFSLIKIFYFWKYFDTSFTNLFKSGVGLKKRDLGSVKKYAHFTVVIKAKCSGKTYRTIVEAVFVRTKRLPCLRMRTLPGIFVCLIWAALCKNDPTPTI